MDKFLTIPALRGSVIPPSSKSQLHRALICAAFAHYPTSIIASELCDDCLATLEALRILGIPIQDVPHERGLCLEIHPQKAVHLRKGARSVVIDCKESGSTLRFLLPLLCFMGIPARITGHSRLGERPLQELISALESNTCRIRKQEPSNADSSWYYELSFAKEHTAPSSITLKARTSSQYVSGILMASAALQQSLSLKLEGVPESWPYIELTLASIHHFYPWAHIQVSDNKQSIDCCYSPSVFRNTHAVPKVYPIENDWSAAAFWLCASALPHCRLSVDGLSLKSSQGDKAILDILNRWGAEIDCAASTTHEALCAIRLNCSHPRGFTWDFSHTPDLACITTVLASCAQGISCFEGCERLEYKESNRLQGCIELACTLGARPWKEGSKLFIQGNNRLWKGLCEQKTPTQEKPPVFESFSDHRFVMSAAIAALLYPQGAYVQDVQCATKSYPRFFEELHKLSVAQEHLQPCAQLL